MADLFADCLLEFFSEFYFFGNEPVRRGKNLRGIPVSLAGARGYAPDPVFEIAGKALDRANDSEKAVDSFCAAGKVEARTRSDSPAGFSGPALR